MQVPKSAGRIPAGNIDRVDRFFSPPSGSVSIFRSATASKCKRSYAKRDFLVNWEMNAGDQTKADVRQQPR